jgi:hypothetical protein
MDGAHVLVEFDGCGLRVEVELEAQLSNAGLVLAEGQLRLTEAGVGAHEQAMEVFAAEIEGEEFVAQVDGEGWAVQVEGQLGCLAEQIEQADAVVLSGQQRPFVIAFTGQQFPVVAVPGIQVRREGFVTAAVAQGVVAAGREVFEPVGVEVEPHQRVDPVPLVVNEDGPRVYC